LCPNVECKHIKADCNFTLPRETTMNSNCAEEWREYMVVENEKKWNDEVLKNNIPFSIFQSLWMIQLINFGGLDQTQGLPYARKILYHRATPQS
jgi:hypothetical protein